MLDIKRLIVATLRADTALRALFGVTANDPRVYAYYEPGAAIDATHKAYITYALTANPERAEAVRQPTFTLAIWSLNWDTAHAVQARVEALLNYEARPFDTLTTDEGRVIQPVLIGNHDSAQENTKFKGIQLTFRIGQSAV